MRRSPQVRVTLSDNLLIHLRKTAQEQHVPLRWLVAGLVCDTLDVIRNKGYNSRMMTYATLESDRREFLASPG